MAAGWQRDKQRSDIFMPSVKQILGRLFIADAPIEIDRTQNTDLMVFTLAPITVACRMRDAAKYLHRFPFDITIRKVRPSGAKSEWEKMVEGWGDYFFYGFGDFSTGRIDAYTVLDLRAVRALLIKIGQGEASPIICEERVNGDMSSTFVAIDWRTLTGDCIRHQYPSDWRPFTEFAA